MTKDEFKILVKGMKAVYTQPSFLPDAQAMEVWLAMLQDIPYKVAQAAIQKHIITSKFPPTIAEIREQAALVAHGELPDWSDGWEQVKRAIRSYGSYNVKKAMESFDDITRQTVERLGFLEICNSNNIAVERANFRTIYTQIAERHQKEEQIPPQLQQAINLLQEGSGDADGRKKISATNPED